MNYQEALECIWCKSGLGKNPKADVSFGRSPETI